MTTGVLDFESLKFQVNLNTGFFECSAYTEDNQMKVTSGNHDQAGMSAGNLQYNYGAADRLQELFSYMVTNYPAVVTTAFGANTAQRDEFINVTNTYTRTSRITWADGITDYVADSSGHILKQPWKDCFGNLLITPECKAKYYSMRDAYYWGSPYDLFRQMSCISRMSLASLFDLFINKGRYYPINLIQVDFDAIDANGAIDATEKERQKIYQINERGNSEENGVSDASTITFAPRRNAMRDQGGTYYGLTYSPEANFDMNQEPAISEKTTSLGVKIGTLDVDNVFLGNTPISSIYLGANLLAGAAATPYSVSTVPQTQFRTNGGSYAGIGAVSTLTLNSGQPLWIDVQNFVACRTYYTTDGSTPTEASQLYTAALSFTSSCTLKTLTKSIFGIAEAVKTLTITVAGAKPTYRYLRILGYGTSTDATTRIMEFEVVSGGTNRMTAATILSSDAPNNTGTAAQIKDGSKATTSNSYPFWWTAVPNAHVVIDLLAQYAIDSMAYYSYSVNGDQRQNRFLIQGSNTNNGTDWANVWDMSTNTTPQPILPSGYTITF